MEFKTEHRNWTFVRGAYITAGDKEENVILKGTFVNSVALR